MNRAMERHDAGEATVIPVILRFCEWRRAPFGKVLATPKDGKPVTAWADRDAAFLDVARQIRAAIEARTIRSNDGTASTDLGADRLSGTRQDTPLFVSLNGPRTEMPPTRPPTGLRIAARDVCAPTPGSCPGPTVTKAAARIALTTSSNVFGWRVGPLGMRDPRNDKWPVWGIGLAHGCGIRSARCRVPGSSKTRFKLTRAKNCCAAVVEPSRTGAGPDARGGSEVTRGQGTARSLDVHHACCALPDDRGCVTTGLPLPLSLTAPADGSS
jgi:hypothetical protein